MKAAATHFWKSKRAPAKRVRKSAAKELARPALTLDLPRVARDSVGADRPTSAATLQLEASLLYTAPHTIMSQAPTKEEIAAQRKSVEQLKKQIRRKM